jgi:hypothetical protein
MGAKKILVRNVTFKNISVRLTYKKILIEMKEFGELVKRRERKEEIISN